MRQATLDYYAAWINWSFDHPWVFALGIALLIASYAMQYRARRGRWGR